MITEREPIEMDPARIGSGIFINFRFNKDGGVFENTARGEKLNPLAVTKIVSQLATPINIKGLSGQLHRRKTNANAEQIADIIDKGGFVELVLFLIPIFRIGELVAIFGEFLTKGIESRKRRVTR